MYVKVCLDNCLFIIYDNRNNFNEIGRELNIIRIGYVTTLGFLCYIVSFLLWQKLLVTYDLSRIVPITTGISQILIIIIGILIFKENVSISSWIGIILIISGVVVTSLSR